MIGTSSFIGIALMIAFGLLLPVGVAFWWLKTRRERLSTVLVGAAVWLIFAVLLESIPQFFLFNAQYAVGRAVLGSAVLYTAAGALLAGLFEETGRYLAFKTVLRRRRNRETSVSYGIGHGGFEVMFLFVITGVQYLVYAFLINSGGFQDMIAAVAARGVDTAALQAMPAQIAAITPFSSCLGLVERIFAMLLHVALSILVFYAVKLRKPRLLLQAILLHALFDVPAALYQYGVITNLLVVEAILAVYAAVFFVVVYRQLYTRDEERNAPQG